MMQIVIDIPEEIYNHTQEYEVGGFNQENDTKLFMAIKNGTPLPKGHGDLVDKNKLITKIEIWDFKVNGVPNYAWICIKDAQVIIEADKESEELCK